MFRELQESKDRLEEAQRVAQIGHWDGILRPMSFVETLGKIERHEEPFDHFKC
jgi:hypothetical protein